MQVNMYMLQSNAILQHKLMLSLFLNIQKWVSSNGFVKIIANFHSFSLLVISPFATGSLKEMMTYAIVFGVRVLNHNILRFYDTPIAT